MKAIMVMFDSLRRDLLPPYGCDWVHAPNFRRLAEHAVTFDNHYVGSLPCMPARRELHTGRHNFLHRGWSPLEPFDDSMPELLKQAGVHTHLVSDHKHYWADGGATYHTRYSTWENVRGQEGDMWKGDLDPSIRAETTLGSLPSRPGMRMRNSPHRQDAVNRRYTASPETSPQRRVFDLGLEFIDTNHAYDDWFLQIESYDPHEPFFTYEEYLRLYDIPDVGREIDWPSYGRVAQDAPTVEHVRKKYAALVSQCDDHLGRVLDAMDKYDLWKDTMLIVNTDHGCLVGDHGWWGKNIMPCYDEIAHIPLFIWDPRSGKKGERRSSLVQTIDLAPTLLEFFGQPIPKDMQGSPLRETVERDAKVRDYALFGVHAGPMNITDGRWVYMRSHRDKSVPLYEYLLMPTRIGWRMSGELEDAVLVPPLPFTKNMPVLKIKAGGQSAPREEWGDLLFDLKSDPKEERPAEDPPELRRLEAAMEKRLRDSDAPEELMKRLGF